MDNRAIERKITSIIQSPELRTITSLNSKTKNIQISVQINGNDAINRACANDGDVVAAMNHILSVLPHPKMYYLKCLAMIAALEFGGNAFEASKLLGISRDSYYHNRINLSEGIKRLNEEGFIGAPTAEDPGGLPSG